MRLHEYYFENILKTNQSLDQNSKLAEAIKRAWGSFEAWEKDFKSMGLMRGIGWVALYYDRIGDHLFNIWINEHDVGHLAGAELILVMDVFEHAYMIDYNLKKAEYIDAFFKVIDWPAVVRRFY